MFQMMVNFALLYRFRYSFGEVFKGASIRSVLTRG